LTLDRLADIPGFARLVPPKPLEVALETAAMIRCDVQIGSGVYKEERGDYAPVESEPFCAIERFSPCQLLRETCQLLREIRETKRSQ